MITTSPRWKGGRSPSSTPPGRADFDISTRPILRGGGAVPRIVAGLTGIAPEAVVIAFKWGYTDAAGWKVEAEKQVDPIVSGTLRAVPRCWL